ncbi:MAG: response regulator, partial [Chloroflexota bacterium]
MMTMNEIDGVNTAPPAKLNTKILVIEDEDRIRNFLLRGLMYEGYEVESASNGPEGLRVAEMFRPDLVLLDLMLPGMDGFEVCRRLRDTTNIPIMMLTAKEA